MAFLLLLLAAALLFGILICKIFKLDLPTFELPSFSMPQLKMPSFKKEKVEEEPSLKWLSEFAEQHRRESARRAAREEENLRYVSNKDRSILFTDKCPQPVLDLPPSRPVAPKKMVFTRFCPVSDKLESIDMCFKCSFTDGEDEMKHPKCSYEAVSGIILKIHELKGILGEGFYTQSNPPPEGFHNVTTTSGHRPSKVHRIGTPHEEQ
jgi:hypothetical protein